MPHAESTAADAITRAILIIEQLLKRGHTAMIAAGSRAHNRRPRDRWARRHDVACRGSNSQNAARLLLQRPP
jgi:hypothetical protein